MNYIESYRHIGIVVKDMEKALNFYCNLLNHRVIVDFTEEGGYFNNLIGLKDTSARVAKVNSPDGVFIELIQFNNILPVDSKKKRFDFFGINHVCFNVIKIHDLYEKLINNGVEFISEPLKSDFDPVYTCFCYDPDDNLIQFVEIFDKKNIKKGLN